MSKFSPPINALNAGEWAPLLNGRTDLEGYSSSAITLENFIPTIQGPITRRAGSAFVRAVKDSSDRTWLVPFIRSRSIAYMIEFGDLYCRFYYQGSPVVTGTTATITGITAANPPVVTTSAAHGYSDGDDVYISGVDGMTEVNGRWFIVANKTATTFELQTIHSQNVDGSGYTAYSANGETDTPYEIVSPYSAANLASSNGAELNIDFVQTGDVVYIAHRGGTVQPQTLSRTSATSWAFADHEPDDGPWLDINAGATTMKTSNRTGSVTITASTSVFTADDVGSLIRIYEEDLTVTDEWKTSRAYTSGDYVRSNGKEYLATTSDSSGEIPPAHTIGVATDGKVEWEYSSPGYGTGRITAQSGTTATVTVLTTFPQTVVGGGNASVLWQKGAWSEANGYPACVTFFRERLCWGMDQRLDMSVVAGFSSHAADDAGEVLATSAVSVTTQSSETNNIVGLVEGTILIVNTEGAEFTVDAPAATEPLGPNNIRVSRQTSYGAHPVRPFRVDESVLFVQASGRKLRALTYTFEAETFRAPDMLVRAEHLGKESHLTQVVRQEEPHQTMWITREDGVLLSFAFDTTQKVRAWGRHTIGGTTSVVECLAVIPSTDLRSDEVWMIVSRTINGATYRYIEYLQPAHIEGGDLEDVKYADCMLTYDSSATTTLYGFDHLEGETVGVLGDGAEQTAVAVSNGEVTITSASVARVGLTYNSTYRSMNIDVPTRDGTAQAKTKRITDVTFRVINTIGGTAGPDATNQDALADLSNGSLYSGDAHLNWPAGYETDGQIWYENSTMFPATITSIFPQVVTEEER